MKNNDIDLLKVCEYGGCSAKLDPTLLSRLLSDIPLPSDPNVLVGLSTHDDAGVYRLNETTALIYTTDFFPPVVSDPYTFGRIAATNALSDVYAMGGKPLMSLNLMHYPASILPPEGLAEIIRGGQSAIDECGAITMGGHTIEDKTPQYGLAVLGTVSPDRLITNSGAKVGQLLVLTKPLGIGTILAGHRLGLTTDDEYQGAVAAMCRLNKYAGELMCDFGVTGATDVTGFGLIGHATEMAEGSNVSLRIYTDLLPTLSGVQRLLDDGCVPGALFRNLRYVGDKLKCLTSLIQKYICADPQTSGGLLVAVDEAKASDYINCLKEAGDTSVAIIGEVTPLEEYPVILE